MKKVKTIKIKDFEGIDDIELVFRVTSYESNNQLAILLYEKKTGDFYADLSVKVGDFEKKTRMAVDIDNFPCGMDIISGNELGRLKDGVESGSVMYPVFEINLEELSKFDPEGVEEFKKLNNL